MADSERAQRIYSELAQEISESGIRVGASAVVVRDGKVLLVKIDDETGPHYNYPGGGHNRGESISDTVKREVLEETLADVEVVRFLFAVEYDPARSDGKFGPLHKLALFFECHLQQGSVPRLPDVLEPNQVGVEWVSLSELSSLMVLPDIGDRLVPVLNGAAAPGFLEI